MEHINSQIRNVSILSDFFSQNLGVKCSLILGKEYRRKFCIMNMMYKILWWILYLCYLIPVYENNPNTV